MTIIEYLIQGLKSDKEKRMTKRDFILDKIQRYTDRFKRATTDDVDTFLSNFGSSVYIITDDDIDYLKSGGIVGNREEYGLIIIHQKQLGKCIDEEVERKE